MKFMLLIYGAEDCWTDEERKECMFESMAVGAELASRGKYLDSSPLEPVRTAATVRVRGGKTLVTDGPFAETAEQLGGYYVLDLADLDEAIAVATRLPPAAKGTVEIRPLFELEGVPPAKPVTTPRAANVSPYLLVCYHEESVWPAAGEDALCAAKEEAAAQCRRIAEEGRFLSASPLHPPALATCVRVRGGKREITDGPFAETKEILGGYYLILAESREQAVQVAAQQPGARVGSVEVRPIFDLSRLRTSSEQNGMRVDSRPSQTTLGR